MKEKKKKFVDSFRQAQNNYLNYIVLALKVDVEQ